MTFLRFATVCTLSMVLPFAFVACAEEDPVPNAGALDAATSAPSAPLPLPSALPSASDAAPPAHDATLAEADARPQVCNDLTNIGLDVPIVSEAREAPVATGGTFVDGTYVLTRASVYTGPEGASGPTGRSMRMTIRKDGPRYDSVFDGVPRRAEVTLSGTDLVTKTTCPSSSTMTVGYSATPTSVMVRFPDGANTRVYVYAKQ